MSFVSDNRDLVSSYLVKDTQNIREAIKISGALNHQILIVINCNSEVVGLVTNKELRTSILYGMDLNLEISSIMNTRFKYLNSGYSIPDIVDLFNRFPYIKQIPVLDNRKLIELISIDDSRVSDKINRQRSNIDADVVIMAGGLGTRLNPFTSIFPKALLPIADETILEKIIKQFGVFGVSSFFISVNYKSNLIKAYLHESNLGYKVDYIEENKPLGTIGALGLAKNDFKNIYNGYI